MTEDDQRSSWQGGNADFPPSPECERQAICPNCNGGTVVINGWLFCESCGYAEIIP